MATVSTISPTSPLPTTPSTPSSANDPRTALLLAKYGLSLDSTTSIPPARPSLDSFRNVRRVEKSIRVRVHYSCHHCVSAIGPDRVCTRCGHRRCSLCPRTPSRHMRDILGQVSQQSHHRRAQSREENFGEQDSLPANERQWQPRRFRHDSLISGLDQIDVAAVPMEVEPEVIGSGPHTQIALDDRAIVEENGALPRTAPAVSARAWGYMFHQPPTIIIEPQPDAEGQKISSSLSTESPALSSRECHSCATAFTVRNPTTCQLCSHHLCNLCPLACDTQIRRDSASPVPEISTRREETSPPDPTVLAASEDPLDVIAEEAGPSASQPTPARVYRKSRQRVRWTCDRCLSVHIEHNWQRCATCGHDKCARCVRMPRSRNSSASPPDPATVQAMNEKLAAATIASSSPSSSAAQMHQAPWLNDDVPEPDEPDIR